MKRHLKIQTRLFCLFAALQVAGYLPNAVCAASIGVHFVRGAGSDVVGVQDGTAISLLPADSAGAGAFAQVNWNNLGVRGTNINVTDSTGTASGVLFNWDANNVWSQAGGGDPAAQGFPDGNLMNGYLDSNNGANTTLAPNLWANGSGNKPLVHVSGLSAWLATQGASYYDVVIYSDGDTTSGRSGEFWLSDVNSDPAAMTVGDDQISHVFICDRDNFVNTATYAEVPLLVQTGVGSKLGNFPGNYAVFDSLSADSFLLRAAEFDTRCVINAIQIIPRTTPLPPTVSAQAPSQVFPGATAILRATVAGRAPQTYRWQKNNADLTDGGNVTGSTTTTLTIANAGAGDAATYSLVVTNPIGVFTNTITTLTVASPVAGSYVEKVVTNEPYAYWRFNETDDPTTGFVSAGDLAGRFSGTYGTALQNGYTAIAGPQPPDFPGLDSGNYALYSTYNIRASWVLAPPLNLNTNTVTFCAWIYPLGSQGNSTPLLQARNGNDTGAFGYGNNNNLGYTWNNNSAATYNFVSGLVPPSDQWSFVALAISPTNAIFYLYNTNGQNSATNTLVHTAQAMTGPTVIGSDNGTLNRTFNGFIDELAVYTHTLPASEIYNLYKKALGLNALPPAILTQPKPVALYEGRTARFAITASGDKPLTYQWRRNGINLSDGGNITGATTASLTISNVTIADNAGDYDIVVGNLAGSITSSSAPLLVVASNSTPSAYEAAVRQANPIAYWRLDETGGLENAYDYWGGIVATHLSASIAAGQDGPRPPAFAGMDAANYAASYDGFSSATETTSSLLNNRDQFSVIGWFNTPAQLQQNRAGLFGQNDVCEFGFHGTATLEAQQVGVWTPRAGAYISVTNIVPDQWYLIAAVGNGTSIHLYLVSTNDGVTVLQASATHSAADDYGNSSYPFRIGGGGILDATDNYFTGLIDEVAVFDRALTADELAGLLATAVTGSAVATPVITVQPNTPNTLYVGRNLQLSVSAVGLGLNYQWRKDGTPISDGGNVYGTQTNTLTITNLVAGNTGNYDVVISNGAGSVTSSNASLTVLVPPAGGFEAAVIAGNPLAYYRLNELGDPSTNTVAYDYWGGHNGTYGIAAQNGFNLIAGPRPSDWTFEADNTALQSTMSTASAWVSAAFGSLSTNTVTFAMWIYPIGQQESWSGLLMSRDGATGGGLGYNDQQMLGYTWNGNTTWSYVSGLIPPTNQWSFVALVIEPTKATLYLGNTNGWNSATNEVAHTSDVFGTWQIGHDSQDGDATRTFNGVIDEVAVYPRSLSLAEVEGLFAAGGGSVPIALTIQNVGGNVVLSWPQGTLLEANLPSGPWTTNNATSPFTNAPTGNQMFYRVIVK